MTLSGPHPDASPSTLSAYQEVISAQDHLRSTLLRLAACLEWERARLSRGLDVEGIDRALGLRDEDRVAA